MSLHNYGTVLMQLAFSVDLEPNKDGSLRGVEDAMEWFNEIVPTGTAFVTYQIADELPDLVARIDSAHEVGVHVHPREFGHDDDQLAELSREKQRLLIEQTREAVADATGRDPEVLTSFRAGRHSCSQVTLDVLSSLGFAVDASCHVRYDEYLPDRFTRRPDPFVLTNGMFEVPTTHVRPPLISRAGINVFPQRTVTATSATLRTDGWRWTGEQSIDLIFDDAGPVSMYMHPYDATGYHTEVENSGDAFRDRLERVLPADEERFVTVSELARNS